MAVFPMQEAGTYGPGDYTPIPDQLILDVEVVKVEVRDKPDWAIKDPERTTEVSFRFKVTNGDYKGRTLFGSAAPYFSPDPRCRLRLWTQAICNMEVTPVDFQLDTNDLTGKQCRVLVAAYENRKGETKNKVQDVFPSRNFVDFEAN